MKSVRTIIITMLALALALAMSCTVFAATPNGVYTFDGSDIKTTNGGDISKPLSEMEPGDTVKIELHYVNDSDETTEWYMKNSVIKTLEDSSTASNGGYSYTLTNVGPDGKRTVLYDSEEVGGEDTHGGTGLEQATNGTDDWFFIQELASGETGKTLLDVTLDGETQVNSYQDTDGSLDIQYAVEKVKEGEKIVKKVTKRKTVTKKVPGNPVNTGDTTNLLPMVGLFAAAVLLLLLAVWNHRRNRKDGEEA